MMHCSEVTYLEVKTYCNDSPPQHIWLYLFILLHAQCDRITLQRGQKYKPQSRML